MVRTRDANGARGAVGVWPLDTRTIEHLPMVKQAFRWGTR